MIRLLFVLFVTLGGFAAAAIWNFRGDGATEQIVSPELKASIAAEVDRLGLQKLAEKLPIPKAIAAETPVDSKPDTTPSDEEPPQRALPATVAVSAAKAAAAKTRNRMNGPHDSRERPPRLARIGPQRGGRLRRTERSRRRPCRRSRRNRAARGIFARLRPGLRARAGDRERRTSRRRGLRGRPPGLGRLARPRRRPLREADSPHARGLSQ